jgi:hypothetical protein
MVFWVVMVFLCSMRIEARTGPLADPIGRRSPEVAWKVTASGRFPGDGAPAMTDRAREASDPARFVIYRPWGAVSRCPEATSRPRSITARV